MAVTADASHPVPVGSRTVGAPDVARAVLLLVVVGVVLRLVLAAAIGLGVDESYMVSVSRGLSLSYFDHPPISFWIPGVLAKVAHSESRVLMRLPFILLFAGTTWLMYRLTARLYGARAGLYAALLINVSPVFSVSTGGWVLPDGPLMFFMLAGALCLVRVLAVEEEPAHPTAWWVGAGVFTGLALLSKYHGIFVAGGAFLFLITRRESRRWLRRPGPWLAAAVMALMFVPVLYWNAGHGWISFRFQGGRAVPAGLDVTSFLQSLGGQAGYVLPWIWVPLVWILARSLAAGPRDAKRWLLVCLAVGPIVVFTLPSLGGHPGLPHWEAPGYLFLFPLLGEAVDRRLREGRAGTRRWLRFSVVGFLLLIAFLATDIATGWVAAVAPSLFRRGDPSLEALDWNELGPALARRGLLADTTRFVAATSWIDAGKVAYALGPDVTTVCLCDRPHQFRFLHPQDAFLGHDAVIVERTPPRDPDAAARFAPYFRSVVPAGSVTLHRLGRPELDLTILVGYDFERARTGPGP
jgi:4-amino-4-deoxy-L-arabinose transferase-like glycosyltransferase